VTRRMAYADPLYEAIARSLREFGYSDVTAQMVKETDEARKRGAPETEPYGIVSMFARRQLDGAAKAIGD
jgi:hypothetical protein